MRFSHCSRFRLSREEEHERERFGRHAMRHRFGMRDGSGEGRGGFGGRIGRFFETGDLRLVILSLIAEKPRYGYEIIKEIEDRVAGAYSPSPGVVYPTLTMLEELGYVTVETGEGGKKQHRLTADGGAFLERNKAAVETIMARIAGVRERFAGSQPQIMRAMENLKLAMRLRLSRGALTEEQIHALTTALDAAATTIERL